MTGKSLPQPCVNKGWAFCSILSPITWGPRLNTIPGGGMFLNSAQSRFTPSFSTSTGTAPTRRSTTNHVVLPVLEDHYGTVLENGLLKIGLRNGGFEVRYRNLALPLHPRSYQKLLKWMVARKTADQDLEKFIQHSSGLGAPTDRESFQRLKDQLGAESARSDIESALQEFEQSPMDAAHLDFLDDLLSEQTYRLVVWRTGTHIANYRRFFDVDSLIAVNMSRSEVFDTAHHLVSDLIQKGQVTGLRIDHIDGLADPKGYLENVQAKLAPKAATAAVSGEFYGNVEKNTDERRKLAAGLAGDRNDRLRFWRCRHGCIDRCLPRAGVHPYL